MGWSFLQRTQSMQQDLISQSPRVVRELAHFDEKIGQAKTAEALIQDPVLLNVALTAFGLEDQLPNKAFLLKVLEEGTESGEAFANRLADKRFYDFAEAFGYGNIAGQRVGFGPWQEDIKAAYLRQSFEIAVGDQDQDLRLALNFVRSIEEIAKSPTAETTGWFDIMGQAPLRQVVEKAFGLPKEFVGLDLDRQHEVFSEKSIALLGQGDPSVFQDPDKVEAVVRRFLLLKQIESGDLGYSPGATALSVLQASGLGTGASAGLVRSFI